jgi:hypothetical protein
MAGGRFGGRAIEGIANDVAAERFLRILGTEPDTAATNTSSLELAELVQQTIADEAKASLAFSDVWVANVALWSARKSQSDTRSNIVSHWMRRFPSGTSVFSHSMARNSHTGSLGSFLDAIELGIIRRGSCLLVESIDRLIPTGPCPRKLCPSKSFGRASSSRGDDHRAREPFGPCEDRHCKQY